MSGKIVSEAADKINDTLLSMNTNLLNRMDEEKHVKSTIVEFARLWGQNEAYCSTTQEAQTSELLQTYDSDECLSVLEKWANEFVTCPSCDSYEFFNIKLKALVEEEYNK